MIKVAIVDDEKLICSEVQNVLSKLEKKHGISMDMVSYFDGISFHNDLRKGEFYDVVFLDIEMDGLTGLEVSKILRESMGNEATQIIYISGKTEYAIDVFDYDPIHFLAKPLSEEKIEKALLKLINRLNLKAESFVYKIGHDTFKVPIKDIIYFENEKRKIIMYYRNQKAEFYGSIENIYQQLKPYRFVQIHRSFIINPLHVRLYTYETVEMSNHKTLQIAQSKRKEIRAMQWILENE